MKLFDQPLDRAQECSNKKLTEQALRKSNLEFGGSNCEKKITTGSDNESLTAGTNPQHGRNPKGS